MGKWISLVLGAQICMTFLKEKFSDVYEKA